MVISVSIHALSPVVTIAHRGLLVINVADPCSRPWVDNPTADYTGGSSDRSSHSGEPTSLTSYFTSVRSHAAMQYQKAVSAYFTSKRILPFGIAEQHCAGCMGRQQRCTVFLAQIIELIINSMLRLTNCMSHNCHSHPTRSGNHLRPLRCRKSAGQKSMKCYDGAILWISITDLIDHPCSFNTFKFHLNNI